MHTMTTQATHTPGPWTVSIDRDKYDSSRDVMRVRAEEDRNHPQGPLTVARMNQYLAAESAANARLIAAAPDLLAALETIAAGNTDADGMVRIAAEALSKAEGRAGE